MKDPAAQSAVIDILNDLLDMELSSVFHILGDNALYIDRSNAELRRPLAEMITASSRRVKELSDLIDQLGGTPIPRGLQAAEKDLAYLSLTYLLPRLIGAKELAIERWESAIKLIANKSPKAKEVLDKHVAEQRSQLALLQHASPKTIK